MSTALYVTPSSIREDGRCELTFICANWLALVKNLVIMFARLSTSSPAFHCYPCGTVGRLPFVFLGLAFSSGYVISRIFSLRENRSIYKRSALSFASAYRVFEAAISSISLSRSIKLYFCSYFTTSSFRRCSSSFCFKNGSSSSRYHDSN